MVELQWRAWGQYVPGIGDLTSTLDWDDFLTALDEALSKAEGSSWDVSSRLEAYESVVVLLSVLGPPDGAGGYADGDEVYQGRIAGALHRFERLRRRLLDSMDDGAGEADEDLEANVSGSTGGGRDEEAEEKARREEGSRRQPLDCNGELLRVGDRVVSTRDYEADARSALGAEVVGGAIIVGEVVIVGERGDAVVAVRHLDGPRKGEIWSAAAWLWRKEP